jgi:hypothetical protein
MPTTGPLTWDDTGKKIFETGTKRGVLYVMDATGAYGEGVAWNGLTAVTESNSGAEETALWADDIKYASLRSAEELGATIEAYQCPPEFYICDGTAEPQDGVTINQQGRRGFGFSYTTTVGNDVAGNDYGEKIHLIYGATASPSERAYQTINDSPDAITLSWELTTTPVAVTGYKPTAHLIVDTTRCDATKLASFKEIIYGSSNAAARLPLPDEVITHFA